MNTHLLLRLLHLAGAFAFVGAHGATAAVTVKLARERAPQRVRAYLELSRATRGATYGSLVVLVGAGVALGSLGQAWGHGWIWTALALLAALLLAAIVLAVPHYRAVRAALERTPVDARELDALLSRPHGAAVLWIEALGLVAILYLMVFKPF